MKNDNAKKEIETLSLQNLDVQELEERLEMTLLPLGYSMAGDCGAKCAQQCASNG